MMSSKVGPGKCLLVADIGGSHITSAVYHPDGKCFEENTCVRVAVDSKGTADEILYIWINALLESRRYAKATVTGLGVAMPGPFDYQNGISYISGFNKYEALYGMNIKKLFAEALEIDDRQILFRNDAEAAVAGEVFAGAGMGLNSVMGITLGSGFGSAHYLNGRCVDLNLGSLPYNATIADDYFSTRWFVKRFADLTGKILPGVRELAGLADIDSMARSVFKEFGLNLSGFIKPHLMSLHPDGLIIGGNISKAYPYFCSFIHENHSYLSIRTSILGEYAALVGAAASFKTTTSELQL